MQLGRQLLARGKAAVHADKLHQIHNRPLPIQFLRIFLRQIVENGGYIHYRRSNSCSWCGGACDCWAAAGADCVCVPGAELAWLKIFDIDC